MNLFFDLVKACGESLCYILENLICDRIANRHLFKAAKADSEQHMVCCLPLLYSKLKAGSTTANLAFYPSDSASSRTKAKQGDITITCIPRSHVDSMAKFPASSFFLPI